MAYDDTKIAEDDILSADWNSLVTEMKTRAKVTSGAGAPTDTPTMIGALYVDTTNLKLYFAAHISDVTGWKKVLSQ